MMAQTKEVIFETDSYGSDMPANLEIPNLSLSSSVFVETKTEFGYPTNKGDWKRMVLVVSGTLTELYIEERFDLSTVMPEMAGLLASMALSVGGLLYMLYVGGLAGAMSMLGILAASILGLVSVVVLSGR